MKGIQAEVEQERKDLNTIDPTALLQLHTFSCFGPVFAILI